MSIVDKKSNVHKVFKLFSRKAKKHTENTGIKVNIDIFYELSWLSILRNASSLRSEIPSFTAFSLFEPAVSPTTT